MNTAGSYHLGVDLGTTYSAAAVARDGRVAVVGLGNRAASIPSVIYLRPDGTILTGEAASRRGPSEPDRVAREFKRRFGDPTPILLGGTPYSAEALTARLLAWVVEKVTELEGGPPTSVTVTHPANWGPYKQDLLRQALRLAGVDASTLTEPEAAAIAYAANERVESGAVVSVYDLGGGTFDAAVLQKKGDGFSILGQPEGIERLGGIDFDEAIVQHVRSALGGTLDQADLDDDQAMAALVRLRAECVDAKEALSTDTETSIAVLLPGLQTEARLTRAEFEQMIRPTLTDTVSALRRALNTAGVEPAEVTAVLLVGGSSRIPLVAELVSDALGRPIAVDAHPKHAIAIGAAHAAALRGAEVRETGAAMVSPVDADPAAEALRFASTTTFASVGHASEGPASVGSAAVDAPQSRREPVAPAWATAAVADDEVPPLSPRPTIEERQDKPRGRRAGLLIGASVGAAALLGAGAWLVSAVLPDEQTPTQQTADDVAAGDADDDADAANAAEDTESSDEEQAASDVPPGEHFVTIDGITVDDGVYVVDFTTYEYEAELPGQHVHFFFDTVPPDQAGVPGDGPWILYGGSSPFTEYTEADRPDGAGQMCALVANPDHSVVAESGTCVDLP